MTTPTKQSKAEEGAREAERQRVALAALLDEWSKEPLDPEEEKALDEALANLSGDGPVRLFRLER